MKRKTQIPLAASAVVYAFFAAACFRLALEHGYERAVSVGEGSFALLGAAGFVAATRSRWRAATVAIGTLPLVGWFLATSWNSGPPFLIASLLAPSIGLAALMCNGLVRIRRT